jgi:ABC-type Fe3+-hydroxamate transport system substrate-binding protein
MTSRSTLTHQQREANGDNIKQETEARSEIKRERIPDDDDDVTFIETRSRKRPHVNPEVIVLD